MRYIYNSPDSGKTIYRKPKDQPNAERELISDEDFFVEIGVNTGRMVLLEAGNGFVGFVEDSS